MIERAAFLSVEAAKVNARIAAGISTPADLRTCLALTRAIAGLIKSLGLRSACEEPAPRQRTLAEGLDEPAP